MDKISALEERVLKIEDLAKSLLSPDEETKNISKADEQSSVSQSTAAMTILQAQKDQAVSENLKLKKEIEKLNYRISHLVKSLNEEEARKS